MAGAQAKLPIKPLRACAHGLDRQLFCFGTT